MEPTFRIGQLAHATGVSTRTIRYYEQEGVLPPASRSASGYRAYTQRDVHRLLLIRRARALGLSLQDLKALVHELDGGSCQVMRPRLLQLLQSQLYAVQKRIAEFQLLQQQRQQVLQRLLASPPMAHADGCRCLEVAHEPDLDAEAVLVTTKGGADMNGPQGDE